MPKTMPACIADETPREIQEAIPPVTCIVKMTTDIGLTGPTLIDKLRALVDGNPSTRGPMFELALKVRAASHGELTAIVGAIAQRI